MTTISAKVYVVFAGRRPGVYLSWSECKAQVNRFKGNDYKGYDTVEQAVREWMAYCIKVGHGEQYGLERLQHLGPAVEDNINICLQDSVEGSSSQTYGLGRRSTTLAPATDDGEFCYQVSMQSQLYQICGILGIPPPAYTLHEVKIVNGREYRRYYASIAWHAIGKPGVSIGRFGRNDYEAKEDVAACLIRGLTAATGKTIRDYNYYNVELLEEELHRVKEENNVLAMENATLTEELKHLAKA